MAKQIIPEELDALIQEYLTDGVLTDKERKVILNKAVNMGLDYDEIDLYLDAQEQKVEQSIDAAARKQKGKVCPFCGKPVPQLAEKCPECGETLTAEASSELQEILDKLEDSLVDFKSGKDVEESKAKVERYIRKAKMYYGSNPKIQKLLAEVETETVNAEKRAKAAARNKTITSILTYNKKLTATVVIVLLILIGWALFGPGLPKSDDEIIADLSEQVTSLVKDGELDKANDLLVNVTILESIRDHGTSLVVDKYDGIYYKVISAYVKAGDLDAAEELAMIWKSKIGNDLSWVDSSCYKMLKSKFKSEGRSFSALKSGYDYNDDED